MDITLLINAIVRQTTVLIAQLATSGGVRAPLSHIANQVFLDLSAELSAQGVSRKVSADMFGMALRAYRKKIQRLGESSTMRGRSLWEAVLEYVEAGPAVSRREVLERFRNDDDALVRSVLHDLVENGLVSSSGSGAGAVYRATTDDERQALVRNGSGLEEFVWVVVYRQGPITTTSLERQCGVRPGALATPLQRLVNEQRISKVGDDSWRAGEFAVPLGAQSGWEAAVFDHYHALVKTLSARLQQLDTSVPGDTTGGSTYTFEVWPGHPHQDEVLGTLGRLRKELGALRSKVEAHNREGLPDRYQSVVIYGGQSVSDDVRSEEMSDVQD
jgi:hypothetical protein